MRRSLATMAQVQVAEGWKVLSVPRSELNLGITLLCGQSFRWREVGSNTWAGVIGNSIVTLKQDDHDHIKYKFHAIDSKNTPESVLNDYFQLSHSLTSLYPVWAASDHSINALFKKSASRLTGVRIMRQPPLECLYSFICSSNNNISRITKMVESLCSTYGTLLGEVEGHKFHSFPTLQQLQKVDEETLRKLGFGYRAKYIVHTTKQLLENEKGWLDNLRKASREDAQKNLVTLMGVGRKVADCVSLFSLDKLDVVPVDTHIFSMAQQHMSSLKGKSLNPAIYEQINAFFRERFGELAGWAHTVLFAGDLAKFAEKAAIEMEKKEKEVKEEEKENVVNESVAQKRKGAKKVAGKKKKMKRA